MRRKLKVELVKCYEVRIVDEEGNVVTYPVNYGGDELALITVYGDRAKAKQEGKDLLDYVRVKLKEDEDD